MYENTWEVFLGGQPVHRPTCILEHVGSVSRWSATPPFYMHAHCMRNRNDILLGDHQTRCEEICTMNVAVRSVECGMYLDPTGILH